MNYIDSHCHMNFAVYEKDLREVVQRSKEAQVTLINVGTQKDTSEKAVSLAKEYEHLWAIIGLHPIHTTSSFHDHDELGKQGKEFTSRGEIFDVDYYRKLAQSSSKVIGIGECGLDYYHNTKETRSAQEKAFREQIQLALELDLPLMLHVRPSAGSYDAYYDVLSILEEYKNDHTTLRGQAHFFAGDIEIAQRFIDLGFFISFTGVITFAKEYEEVIREISLEYILSETDAPYVTPVPHRGQRNEPSFVIEVVKKIAAIKEISEESVAKQIKKNIKSLYGFEY